MRNISAPGSAPRVAARKPAHPTIASARKRSDGLTAAAPAGRCGGSFPLLGAAADVNGDGPRGGEHGDDIADDQTRNGKQAFTRTISRRREAGAHQHAPGKQPPVDDQQGDEQRINPHMDGSAERFGEPDLRPQQRGTVSGEKEQRGERPTAVAQAHPALAEAAAPAEPVPAGKRDAAEPARLLPHRVADGRREMAAAGDHAALARPGGDSHEHGLEAERADPEAHFIILEQQDWMVIPPLCLPTDAVVGGGEPR
jgi:hypothetical protein